MLMFLLVLVLVIELQRFATANPSSGGSEVRNSTA